MLNRFKGVIPPMLTAFDETGNLDIKRTKNIAKFLKDKVDALFICGTYGSGPLMNQEEKERVIEEVSQEVNGKIPIIVMVGSASTKETVEIAKYAEKMGAAAVASVCPYYYAHSEENILGFFSELVGAVDIPVYVYNNPKTVGYPVTPKLLRKLYEIGVKGLKDSSFSSITFYEFIRELGKEDFDFIIGTEALVLDAFALGSKAVISGVANALPEPVVDLTKACQMNNLNEAARLQTLVLELRELLHISSAISVAHAILQIRGIDSGYPRKPFKPLSNEKMNELKTRLSALKLPL
ncbi:dihydrodipicolinate synthase family protein [Thermotoga profunda]|uniref:dihydrodipicolinate synthase family protein n=1 Tax=Thermotoga profunda TaxID=1508420 RepID=UPI0006939B8A|nr:dihydrodipicolinate synthase family protein [Thermotoga profunda]